MINAVHVVLYTKDARRLRAFFRDTLKFRSVDAGDGWLIFALPPAELGVHPAKKNAHELYLMCDDIQGAVKNLKRKGVIFTEPVRDVGFGLLTSLKIPGGGELGLYEPKHKSPLKLTKKLRPR